MISRVYAKESKRITFSHGITSLRESVSIENQNQMERYQTGAIVALILKKLGCFLCLELALLSLGLRL